MGKLLLLSGVFLSAACMQGQSDANKGQIAGTIFDAKHAVVPNAKITIRNAGTGLKRELFTNEAGQYRVVLLDPGIYELTADHEGFASSKVKGLVLSVGTTVGLDIVLQVQSTVTSVEVGATLIALALPAPSTTISTAAIANLPINGRRFHDFATLTPTVQVDPQRGQLSFAGQRGIYANVMLDGADYNQPFFGGIRGGERSGSIFTVPQSAIQEFQVVVSGYSAEYGRSTGGVLNTITKSGTNEWHGDSFYQIRHKEMGAKDPVQLISSLETQHQWGASTGGPLKSDKLFLFGAFERQDAAQARRVFFAQLAGRTSTATTQEAFDFFKSEERPFTQTNDAMAFTVRGDYQTPSGHRLTLRYNFSGAAARNAVSVGGALIPFTNRAFSNDGIEKDRTHTGTAQYTHLFSASAMNDLRFTGTYEVRPRLSNSELPQVTTVIGTFGARNFLPTTQDDQRLQFSDAIAINLGRHTFKLGFDYNRVTAGQLFGFNQFGAFSLAGSDVVQHLEILSVGGTVAPNRFDHSSVTYTRQIGNLTANMGMHQVAAFAQDSWRVSPKLTLDFGARWEGQYNPQPEASNTTLADRVRAVRFPNGASLDPSRIQNNTRQAMPRFGFAYTPWTGSRRTVVRGYAGIFYASTPLLVVAGPTNNFRTPPGDVSIQLTPSGANTVYAQLLAVGVDLNSTPLGQLPVIPLEAVQRAAQLARGGTARDPFTGANLVAMANDFENPRSVQSGIGFESEVKRNLIAGVQFTYLNTVHLLRNRDYNVPVPVVRVTDATQRPFYGLRGFPNPRPIPTLASIWVRESSSRSMYRAVTASTQYRARRLQFGSFYTWGENFSDDDSERDATGVAYADAFDLLGDYGYARGDIRHQFAGYAVISLPLGFEVGMTAKARSGVPVNPLTGGDTNDDLGNTDRAYSAPGVSLARNSFRNRKVIHNDMRVMRNFKLGDSETRRLQFSVEFFNLLNLDNVVYSGVNGGVSGGTYGLGIAANGQPVPVDTRFLRLRNTDGTYDRQNAQVGTPLQVQFGLRFFF